MPRNRKIPVPKMRVKRKLRGDGFFDTITSWGRSVVNAYTPKLITGIPAPSYTPDPTPPPIEGGLPDKSILKDIADNSYKATSDDMKDIPGFTLKLKTPTLVIYQKDTENMMVIGVRGTADFRDFRAWFSTAFNVIPDSQRFKEDIQTISDFQQKYPVNTYTYYATGHSLGGTLIDELIKKGMVKEARTYNPAIETSDIPDVALSKKNHRIYADGDPLYLLQGRFDNPTEVRKSYKYYPSSMYDFVPGYDKYKQHVLANPVFVGGKTNPFYHLQGAGIMANSQFYRTDPKRNPLLRGEGIWDDVKKGIESVYGKAPISAHHVWTPAEQADINRRQRIIDVDKKRAEMVAKRVDYAYKNVMDNAQHKNVVQAYFKQVGTDNVKDYFAKVRELANKAAEEFYPY